MKRTYQVTIELEVDSETVRQGKELAKKAIESMALLCREVKSPRDSRTGPQNRSLHKYLSMIADEAQNSGQTLDMLVLKPSEFPITETMLKDFFREIGRRMFGKDSTSLLEKHEFQKILEVFDKAIAERLEIYLPFPSDEKENTDILA